MHSLSTSSRHSQWIFNQLQFKQVAPCLVLLGPGEAWVILTMPSIASPLMAGTYVCSSVYTLWHLKSIPNMSSKIPAWRWQRSKCPCLSSQIWSQSSSCWVFWIQTLLPDTLSMSLAPPPCSHSDSVTIKCYPNRRAVHMRAGRGHSHHPLCAVLSKLSFYFPHSFHSKAPCNLPCFVLALLYLFACFFFNFS